MAQMLVMQVEDRRADGRQQIGDAGGGSAGQPAGRMSENVQACGTRGLILQCRRQQRWLLPLLRPTPAVVQAAPDGPIAGRRPQLPARLAQRQQIVWREEGQHAQEQRLGQ